MKETGKQNRIRALIAEDEPPARRLLRNHLAEHEDIEVIAEATDGADAVEKIRTLDPDLVFLDIQMPELNGLEVIDVIGPDRMPPVVFLTAHDSYAIQAFDVQAVDYLLKPLDGDRLRTALDRIRARIHDGETTDLARLLTSFGTGRSESPIQRRIPVSVGSRIRMIRQADIDRVTAEGNYVRVHVGAESHQLRDSLSAIERRLDSNVFLRVHRSTIVNVERVLELEPLFKGEYILRMRDGSRIGTGRSYREQVRATFGL